MEIHGAVRGMATARYILQFCIDYAMDSSWMNLPRIHIAVCGSRYGADIEDGDLYNCGRSSSFRTVCNVRASCKAFASARFRVALGLFWVSWDRDSDFQARESSSESDHESAVVGSDDESIEQWPSRRSVDAYIEALQSNIYKAYGKACRQFRVTELLIRPAEPPPSCRDWEDCLVPASFFQPRAEVDAVLKDLTVLKLYGPVHTDDLRFLCEARTRDCGNLQVLRELTLSRTSVWGMDGMPVHRLRCPGWDLPALQKIHVKEGFVAGVPSVDQHFARRDQAAIHADILSTINCPQLRSIACGQAFAASGNRAEESDGGEKEDGKDASEQRTARFGYKAYSVLTQSLSRLESLTWTCVEVPTVHRAYVSSTMSYNVAADKLVCPRLKLIPDFAHLRIPSIPRHSTRPPLFAADDSFGFDDVPVRVLKRLGDGSSQQAARHLLAVADVEVEVAIVECDDEHRAMLAAMLDARRALGLRTHIQRFVFVRHRQPWDARVVQYTRSMEKGVQALRAPFRESSRTRTYLVSAHSVLDGGVVGDESQDWTEDEEEVDCDRSASGEDDDDDDDDDEVESELEEESCSWCEGDSEDGEQAAAEVEGGFEWPPEWFHSDNGEDDDDNNDEADDDNNNNDGGDV